MAYTLGNKCAKNLCKRIVLLQLIIENVVTCFFWNTVYISQCSTLVRNTVVRATHTVNGRLGNSTPRGSKTPETIEMKLYMVDYVTHPTPHAQFG